MQEKLMLHMIDAQKLRAKQKEVFLEWNACVQKREAQRNQTANEIQLAEYY